MADDNQLSAKDILDHIEKYHKQIVTFAEKTTKNIATLHEATEIVKGQQDTLWTRIKTASPLIFILLVLIGLVLMRPLGICKVSVTTDKGVEIVQCGHDESKEPKQ